MSVGDNRPVASMSPLASSATATARYIPGFVRHTIGQQQRPQSLEERLVHIASVGRVSDKAIVLRSGLLDPLEPADASMADRGFLIDDAVAARKLEIRR